MKDTTTTAPQIAGWVQRDTGAFIAHSEAVARYRSKTPGEGWEPVVFAKCKPLTAAQLAAGLSEIAFGDEEFAGFDFADWSATHPDHKCALDQARIVMQYCAEAWGVQLVGGAA